jgi:hypothetical protein
MKRVGPVVSKSFLSNSTKKGSDPYGQLQKPIIPHRYAVNDWFSELLPCCDDSETNLTDAMDDLTEAEASGSVSASADPYEIFAPGNISTGNYSCWGDISITSFSTETEYLQSSLSQERPTDKSRGTVVQHIEGEKTIAANQDRQRK